MTHRRLKTTVVAMVACLGLAAVCLTTASCRRDRSDLCESLADTFRGCVPEQARAMIPSREALIENCLQDFRDCPNNANTCTEFMDEKARLLSCALEAGCAGLTHLTTTGMAPPSCR